MTSCAFTPSFNEHYGSLVQGEAETVSKRNSHGSLKSNICTCIMENFNVYIMCYIKHF